jgi:hypothetical protein
MTDVASTHAVAEQRPDQARRWVTGKRWAVDIALVTAISAATVLRYGGVNLNADGVEQSTMSIQHPTLFYWGQDRLAAFVSFLASPVSNPEANLFACMLINAIGFHALLRLLAGRMAPHVLSSVEHRARVVTFLVLTAVTHLVLAPYTIHALALEGQPYSWSWVLALGSFLLWRVETWPARAIAVLFVGIAVGLNPAAVLAPAFLALLDLISTRRLLRWVLFGAVWVGWLGVWILLMRHVTIRSPLPEDSQGYFSFHPHEVASGLGPATANIVNAFRVFRLLVLSGVALAVLAVASNLWSPALTRRFVLAALFCLGYVALFAGNPWITANGLHFRYFFPVFPFVAMAIAAPLLMALRSLPPRPALVPALAAVAMGLALVGHVQPAWDAPIMRQTAPIAQYAEAQHVRFISGDYWLMWPTMHHMLERGRDAVYVAGLKSGGDYDAYKQALAEELRTSVNPPEALCLRSDSALCTQYLDYYTAPGWTPGERCRIPHSSVPCTRIRYLGSR